jgi:hypothetical protein
MKISEIAKTKQRHGKQLYHLIYTLFIVNWFLMPCENKGNTCNHDIISNSIKRGELAIENVPPDEGRLVKFPWAPLDSGSFSKIDPHRAGRFNSYNSPLFMLLLIISPLSSLDAGKLLRSERVEQYPFQCL